jgi:4-amino-4-deoxy-L-arabinose transferase-like glycosyltransferase
MSVKTLQSEAIWSIRRVGIGESKTKIPDKKSSRLLIGTVCTVALTVVLRMLPLLRSGNEWSLTGDSYTYLALARGLRIGCGFAQAHPQCGAPEIFRTPGYPAFLALLPGLRWVVAVQALMSGAICLLIVTFVWPRWGWKAALTAGALIAFDVPSIEASSVVLTDILFSVLLTSAVIAQLWIISRGVLDRKAAMMALLAALLLGMDALVRPTGLVLILAAPLPLLMIRPQSRSQQILLVLATLMIPTGIILGWMERNWNRARFFTVSTEASFQIYFHRAAESVWIGEGASLKQQDYFDAQDYLYDQLCSKEPGYCIPYVPNGPFVRRDGLREWVVPNSKPCQNIARYDCSSYSPQAFQVMWQRGLQICVKHAPTVALVTFASFAYMAVNPYDSELYLLVGARRIRTGSLTRRFMEAMGAPTVAALTLLTAGLLTFIWVGVGFYLWQLAYRGWRAEARLLLYPLVLALALMALSAGPLEAIQMRFRVPSIPFLAMVAAIGWFGRSAGVSRMDRDESAKSR